MQHSTLEHKFILFLMFGYMAVDALVGMFEIHMGIHLKVSVVYKIPVLLLMLYLISSRDLKFTLIIICCLLFMLIAPTVQLARYSNLKAYVYDISILFKVLSPLIYLRYFMLIIEQTPKLLRQLGPKIMWVNYFVILFNMVLGIAGLGYHSYQTGDTGIGINGYFAAGNELGAVYIVLSCYLLSRAYQVSARHYSVAALLTLVVGLLISTKTSILSGLIMVTVFPLLAQRRQLFRLTSQKLVIFTSGLLLFTVFGFYFVDLLKATGLWDRLVWTYESKGILRVIFSGREEFTFELLHIFHQHNWFHWLFGISSAGIQEFWLNTKLRAEIDPIDVMIGFGYIGLLIAALIQMKLIHFSINSYKRNNSPISAGLVLSMTLLTVLAFFSGHIWLSGMLGPFLAMLMVLSELDMRSKTPNSIASD